MTETRMAYCHPDDEVLVQSALDMGQFENVELHTNPNIKHGECIVYCPPDLKNVFIDITVKEVA
jgi:hypothetical protein